MSLLFLSNILDAFQALDDAGRPLPQAQLTFWRAGTTIPKPVYADQELAEQLSDAAGRVMSDAQGLFPLIYLAADPEPPYRVLLHTAQGVLRFDVDPYLCDCTEPPFLFRGPKPRALTEAGATLPGAKLTFTLTETETPTDTYADAELTVPHPNPLSADAGGSFPPVYLDDAIDYRVRLADRAGNLLLDVDPYVCQCGFLLLTSRPYAYEFMDALEAAAAVLRDVPSTTFIEAVAAVADLFGGTLVQPLVTYDDGEPEALEAFADVVSGALTEPLVTYDDGDPEALEAYGDVSSGELLDVLISYDDGEPEALEAYGDVLSGELT